MYLLICINYLILTNEKYCKNVSDEELLRTWKIY